MPARGAGQAAGAAAALALPVRGRGIDEAPLPLTPLGLLPIGSLHRAPCSGDDGEEHCPRAFLDEYILGEMLGQGAFGVVYSCRRLLRDDVEQEQAVKMVDKVETPPEQIRREAEIQKQVLHPNVVRVHDVFFEPCFVCIVMDICRGGDLIGCLEGYWDSGGEIDCSEVMHVTKQMVASVQCLHTQGIIHRDVKGDNYLLDRSDLVDPQCRVLLTDFGTARELRAGERLCEAVGTSGYWSPEFYSRDYGFKVDIWALGVVMHGLYAGTMPFNGEREVREKAVELSSGTPSDCADFVRALLRKAEAERPAADEVLSHPWLCSSRKRASSGGCRARLNSAWVEPSALREGGAHPVVNDRRCELVTRMRTAAKTKGDDLLVSARRSKPVRPISANEGVVCVDRETGSTRTFEWWSKGMAEAEGVMYVEPTPESFVSDADCNVSAHLVGKMLASYGISTDRWGQGAFGTLEQFAAEVQHGTARLMLDATGHKKLVRVVDLVMLRLSLEGGEQRKLLVEWEQVYPDGRLVANSNRLPGAKRMSHENTRQVAERIVTQFMNLSPSMVSFDYRHPEVFEQTNDSRSYPGVSTVYRTEIVSGFVTNLDHPSMLQARDLNFQDSFGVTRSFGWWSIEECEARGVSVFPPPDVRTGFSGLVPAPMATDEQELRQLLEGCHLDSGLLDEEGIKALAVELIRGKSRLAQSSDGRLRRVVELVVLRLVKGRSGELLVEASREAADGGCQQVKRLPAGKRRPDENPFWCANSILTSVLKLDDNCVCFDKDEVSVVEEFSTSTTFRGLPTVYRKHIITGTVTLLEEGGARNQQPSDELSDMSLGRHRLLSAWRAESFCDDGYDDVSAAMCPGLSAIPSMPPGSPRGCQEALVAHPS